MDLVIEKTNGNCDCDFLSGLYPADRGRIKINLTKDKMPGLISCRRQFRRSQPLRGARISIFYEMNTLPTFLTNTLTDLGAEVFPCKGNIFYTQYFAEGNIYWPRSFEIHREKHWRDILRALDCAPNMIVDYSGDATLLIHEGVKAEEIYAKTGQMPDPSSAPNPELRILLTIISEGLESEPMKYHNMKEGLVGISVEIATGVERLLQMQANGTLSFPVFNISDFVTKSKFIKSFGGVYALGRIKRATNMKIFGNKAVVCGYDDDAIMGCAIALRKAGADVVVSEVDPNYATQARLSGFSVIENLDYVVPEADIFVTNFNHGNNIHLLNHIKKMKNNAIVYITDPTFHHNSSTYSGLEQYFSGMEKTILDCQTDKWVCSDTNSCVIVLSNIGYPDLMLSWSYTSHGVAMLEFWSQKGTGSYVGKVYALPEHLEERVSYLHLDDLEGVTAAKKETIGLAAAHFFVPTRGRENPFTTTTTAESMNMSKILTLLIQVFPIIGFVVYAFNKVTRAEFTYSATWGN